MSSRRDFLKKAGVFTAAMSLTPFAGDLFANGLELPDSFKNYSGNKGPEDEVFWKLVREAYCLPEDFANLESGYFNPQPSKVLNAQTIRLLHVNKYWSFYMRREWETEKKKTLKKLADYAGCSDEEIVIQRNTTEALNNIIMGFDFAQDDEIIYSDLDYPSMKAALKQKEKRDKIKLIEVSLPLNPKSVKEIVDIFEKAITKKTKVIHLTHAVFLTGMILPVKEVCAMAHSHNVEVIVDAAHSFAHTDFKISDLDCDYLGTSLHKWLAAPMGNGLLYIKKSKISKMWALMGDTEFADDDIRKFDHLGTVSPARYLSISDAIDFQEALGLANKAKRLKYLRNYWLEKVKNLPGIIINSPTDEKFACGIGNAGVEGKTPKEVCDFLYEKHKVFTVAIDGDRVKGARVSPNVFTTTGELDKLVEGFKELCS